MKTCALDGCDGIVKYGALFYCSIECGNKAKTINRYIMVENCVGCDAKMQESDYHKELSGTACSKYCKSCRGEKKVKRVGAKKNSREDFLALWRFMNKCNLIFRKKD
jgi:hypothetical protein